MMYAYTRKNASQLTMGDKIYLVERDKLAEVRSVRYVDESDDIALIVSSDGEEQTCLINPYSVKFFTVIRELCPLCGHVRDGCMQVDH